MALWVQTLRRKPKAVSRYACHLTPDLEVTNLFEPKNRAEIIGRRGGNFL